MGLLACSGPGAADLVSRAVQLGHALLLLTVAICLIPLLLTQVREALGRTARLPLIIPLAHPGWWLSARLGDCGATRLLASTAATVLAALVVIALLWRAHTAQDREPKPES